MDPNNLSGKDVLAAISPIAIFIVGVAFLAKEMYLASGIFLVPFAIFFAYSFIKAPWKEIGRIAYEKEQIQKQTIRGRAWLVFQKALDYLSLISTGIFVLVIGLLIYARYFTNAS